MASSGRQWKMIGTLNIINDHLILCSLQKVCVWLCTYLWHMSISTPGVNDLHVLFLFKVHTKAHRYNCNFEEIDIRHWSNTLSSHSIWTNLFLCVLSTKNIKSVICVSIFMPVRVSISMSVFVSLFMFDFVFRMYLSPCLSSFVSVSLCVPVSMSLYVSPCLWK